MSELVLGYFLAQLLMRDFPLKGLFRTIHTLPLMVAPIAVGATWRLLTVPGLGPIPYYLERWFGIDYRLGIVPRSGVPHHGDHGHLALDAARHAHLLAGLAALPKEPFEQAQVDGANRFQIFWHITLPLLRPVILTTVFIRLMDALRTVDEVWMLTGGGPGAATRYIGLLHLARGVPQDRLRLRRRDVAAHALPHHRAVLAALCRRWCSGAREPKAG